MRNPYVLSLVWIATVVLAWLVGANYSGKGASKEPRAGKERVVRDEPEQQRPPRSREPDAPARDAKDTAKPGEPSKTVKTKPAGPFTLEGLNTVDDVSRRLMEYAESKLAEGPDGHRELMRVLDMLMKDPRMREFLRDDAAAARALYPWIRFLVEHERQVFAMAETLYKTAAERPEWFEGLDDNSFEIFTEGLALLMPGALDEETLARFRGYVEQILARGRESLPEALQGNFRDLTRNLEWWAAPLSTDEVLAKINDPNLGIDARLALMGKLERDELKQVDFVGILSPAIAQGSMAAINMVSRVPWNASDLVAFDASFFTAVGKGKVSHWTIRSYLSGTRRGKWADARAFIEEGLNHGGKETEVFALAVAWLRQQPPKTYVEQLLATYDLSAAARKQLKLRFNIE